MHPHEIADYLQQDRITVSFPECGPVSEVMAGIATLQRRLKELQGIQPGRCLGYTHRTQPDGTTIPVSMVIEGPNGEWVDAPLPVAYTRNVMVAHHFNASNGRDYELMFGRERLFVTAAEFEKLIEIIVAQQVHVGPVKGRKYNLCKCDCGSTCPLGKMGMDTRCSEKKLREAGIPVVVDDA